MPKMKKDRHGVVKASNVWSDDNHTDNRATYKAPNIRENFDSWNGLDLEEVVDEYTQKH